MNFIIEGRPQGLEDENEEGKSLVHTINILRVEKKEFKDGNVFIYQDYYWTKANSAPYLVGDQGDDWDGPFKSAAKASDEIRSHFQTLELNGTLAIDYLDVVRSEYDERQAFWQSDGKHVNLILYFDMDAYLERLLQPAKGASDGDRKWFLDNLEVQFATKSKNLMVIGVEPTQNFAYFRKGTSAYPDHITIPLELTYRSEHRLSGTQLLDQLTVKARIPEIYEDELRPVLEAEIPF